MTNQKYIRDSISGAILNKNASEKQKIEELREKARTHKEIEKRLSDLEERMERYEKLVDRLEKWNNECQQTLT